MTPPENLELRLRSSQAPEITNIDLDIYSYMSGPGRYASAFQTEIVSRFFNGDLPADIFTRNEDNELQVSYANLIELGIATKQQGSVSISQYTTDTQSSDWVDRAYVFGSTSFLLNTEAIFVLGDNGPYIKGAVMMPLDTDFDLVSKSALASAFNDNLLQNALDPYGIGRKVDLSFTEQDKHLWRVAHENDIITAGDTPPTLVDFVQDVLNYANIDPIKALLTTSDLLDRVWQAARYIEDGRNIIFGTNGNDEIGAHSGKGYGFDYSLPNAYIAGEGNDTVTTTQSAFELVYGGFGDDTIMVNGDNAIVHGGFGNDLVSASVSSGEYYGEDGDDEVFIIGSATADGGSGNDVIHASGADNKIVAGAGADTIYLGGGMVADRDANHVLGADTSDKIYSDGLRLTGGDKVPVVFGSNNLGQLSSGSYFQLMNADEHGIYDIVDNNLIASLKGGGFLIVDDFSAGLAGINASASEIIFTTDIAKEGLGEFAARINDVSFVQDGDQFLANYAYQGLVKYSIHYLEGGGMYL